MMKPFKAPTPAITTPMVTINEAHGPQIAAAASACGAGEVARVSGGRAPITPMVLRM